MQKFDVTLNGQTSVPGFPPDMGLIYDMSAIVLQQTHI